MFHLKEGWFFERLSDGSVMVTKRKDAGMESPIITRMIVPPEEWASVVASVSAGNEFNGRWKQALDFHSGLTKRAPDLPKRCEICGGTEDNHHLAKHVFYNSASG